MKRACISVCSAAFLAGSAMAGSLQAVDADLATARGLVGAEGVEAPNVIQASGTMDAGCYWDNGAWDGRDGQASSDGSFFPFARAADDFYLADGKYYYVDKITVQMLVKSPEDPISTLELYDDCNGVPSTLRATYEQSDFSMIAENVFGLYTHYEITYDVNCWLPGGCAYWVSPVGQARDCSCDGPLDHDQYFFCTAGYNQSLGFGDVQGIEGHFLNPDLGFSDWTPAAVTCSCKTDYCFKVYADPCWLLRDQGDFDGTLGAPSVISTAFPDQRTADDFVLATADRANPQSYEICTILACVFTNCKVADYILEVYEQTNEEVTDSETGETYIRMCPGELIAQFTDPKAISLGISQTTTEGFLVDGYELQFETLVEGTDEMGNPAMVPLQLEGGKTYWVSAVGRGQGAIRDRSFFCFASNCRKPADCLINWMEPKFNKNVSGNESNFWQDLSELVDPNLGDIRNLGFKVLGREVPEPAPADPVDESDSDFESPIAPVAIPSRTLFGGGLR